MNRELNINESILQLASSYLGLQEIKGSEHNDVIVDMFKDIRFEWVKTDETAWCSCFVNFIAYKLGLFRSCRLDARSWLKVGEAISYPRVGDIVIFWREDPKSWKGHVGIFIGYNRAGNVMCLGGNQGNEVCISTYNKDRLLGFRRLQKK